MVIFCLLLIFQGFKGPALTAAVFRDAFSRIFGVRLSFPEMGVFLKCLGFDRSGLSIDGLRFLNAFYKLGKRRVISNKFALIFLCTSILVIMGI